MKKISLFSLMLVAGVHAMAQTHTVTGKVVDEKGQGYPGAGVTVKGSQVGTVTDVNGDFMLQVPDGNNSLIIQAVGYQNYTAKDDGKVITARLQPTAKQLEGTVVTALAMKREKRELGYNATTVTSEDLTAANNTSSLSSLQGKVAGANITSSTGGPGGSTRIVLRGESSILKNNNALIIVDGVITNNYDRTVNDQLQQVDFGNSANDIDPDEIESISVLPGPAAAALYGSQATNGAIMITTKKGKHSTPGKPSKMEITYKATYTQSDILKYADLQHTYGQGNIYAGVADDRRENFSWGLPFDNQLRPWGQIIDGKQLVKPYSDQPNNIKSFFNHGKDLNNFVSVSGGSEKSTYFLSINSLNSSGVVPNTFYNKYSVRFNGTTQLGNNFYSEINVNYINSYSRVENGGQNSGSILDNLYEVARDIPVWELKDYNNKFYSMQFTDTSGIQRYGNYGAYYKNPYWLAQYYDNRNQTDRMLGDIKLGYKKGSFNVYDRLGMDVTADRSYYETPYLNSVPVDPFYATINFTNNGGYTENHYNGLRLYNDVVLNFTHKLSENFGLNANVGQNAQIFNDRTTNASIDPTTNGLVIPGFYNFSNNKGPVTVVNTLDRIRRVGVYGDFAFNYLQELFLEVTARKDWSSTLGTSHNGYFYPGTNASWVFTERLNGTRFKEKVLNYGKIRAGLASVSNDGIAYANNNAGFTQAPITSAFGTIQPPFNSVPAYSIQQHFGINGLKPELTKEFEIGTDLSFLQDRISTSFTYYRKYTSNLITLIDLSNGSGYTQQYNNIGDMSNRGVEIALRGTPIKTHYGLKWELFGTFTKNVNNVEKLAEGQSQYVVGGYNSMSIVAAVGHPFGTFYATDIEYWQDPKGGWHAVVDPKTGQPMATSAPVYKGSFQPKFQASWGTELTYKGLKLHVLFVTKQGGEFFSRNKVNMDFNGTSQESTINNRNPLVWANSVNNLSGNYVANTTPYSPYQYFTYTEQQKLYAQGLVNASYVKLQELAISYKIPQKYYQRTPFGGLEAGLFGNNLLLWTAKSNKYDDPEETSAGSAGNGQGFNFTARPSLRNYGAFIKVTF